MEVFDFVNFGALEQWPNIHFDAANVVPSQCYAAGGKKGWKRTFVQFYNHDCVVYAPVLCFA